MGYDRGAKRGLLRSAHRQTRQCSSALARAAGTAGGWARSAGRGHPIDQPLGLIRIRGRVSPILHSPRRGSRGVYVEGHETIARQAVTEWGLSLGGNRPIKMLSRHREHLTPNRWAEWYAIPLRLIVGYGFIEHGYAKLARGPESFTNILHALGMPLPSFLAWATIAVEDRKGVVSG